MSLSDAMKDVDAGYVADMVDPVLKASRVMTTCKSCGRPCDGYSVAGRVMPIVCDHCCEGTDPLVGKFTTSGYETAGLYGEQFAQTFAGYVTTDGEAQMCIKRKMEAFAAAKYHPWVVLSGSCGTGKDHLASAVVKAWVDRKRRCFAESATGILAKYRDMAYGDGGTGEVAALKWFARLDLLVIRDLGAKVLTQAETATLIDLIDRIDTSGGSIIITTNVGAMELRDMLTGRVMDRIAGRLENGQAWLCEWPSYRRKNNHKDGVPQ